MYINFDNLPGIMGDKISLQCDLSTHEVYGQIGGTDINRLLQNSVLCTNDG